MRIVSVRHIDGPNVFLYKPILMAKIHLEEYTGRESSDYEGFSSRLLQVLPGLSDHHCAKGRPGGFVERLHGGTYFGHIVEHVAIELCTYLDLDVHYGKTMLAEDVGIYDIVMECKAYETQRYLLSAAVDVVKTLVDNGSVEIDPILAEARDIFRETELGPSTKAIVEACKERDIPVRRLGTGSVLELGYGRHRKRLEATLTDASSAVALDLACDKEQTKLVLAEAAIPVPRGGVAYTEEEALREFRGIGAPVVAKPRFGNQGRGVSLCLATELEVVEAFRIACRYGTGVVIEEYKRGQNIRALCVGGNLVAAALRMPATVVGDGEKTIRQLVDATNASPLRGVDHECPLTKIHIDEIVLATLDKHGLTLDSVPAPLEAVVLRDSANLSTGGEAEDVTDKLHPVYAQLAERAARAIGLDVCGIDLVIEHPFSAQVVGGAVVIEVNAAPGIRMHEHPSFGHRRRVAKAIVDALYPNDATGRIPIVSITGTNGKTTTTRLIAHGLREQGHTVGMTTTEGVYVGDSLILSGDTTGPQSARVVLSDPTVDVAVLETARGGICRGGLAYDYADVAVLTNISGDHLGQDGLDTIADLVRVKSLVAECVKPTGYVVLNADCKELLELQQRLNSRIILFSASDANRDIMRHAALGGWSYYVDRGFVVEAMGSFERAFLPIADVPITLGGKALFQVENVLAAVAALRALGLSRERVATALCAFEPRHNAGRVMLYRLQNGGHVLLDYGHNPAGFASIGDWLKTLPVRRLIGVVGVPGDRANEVVTASADALSNIFHRIIVKEDEDKRGRADGEIARLLAHRIQERRPDRSCQVVLDELSAFRSAVSECTAQDMVVVFYEHRESLVEHLLAVGAVPVETVEMPLSQPQYVVL